MFSKLFASKPTSRTDVLMAITAAIVGVYKAYDTIQDYRSNTQNKEINS